MLKANGYGIGGTGYGKTNATGRKKSTEAKSSSPLSASSSQKTEELNITNNKIESSEDKLSAKAQKYLEQLRKEHGDYDFIVANADDNMEGLVGQATKEFAVVFSTDELERMADDKDFAAQQMSNVDKAVKISKMLMGEDGELELEDGVKVSSVSISFDDKGTMKMFAELEKSTANMNEKSEAAAKKRTEEKKAEAKKAESDEKSKENAVDDEKDVGQGKPKTISLKHTSVSADTIDELLDEIGKVDWDKIAPETFIAKNSGKQYA